MRIAIQLALRNLLGAGLRTWLNAIVLSFSFVAIIWMQGLMVGWDYQAKRDMQEWEIGKGQYWHALYDPYDALSLENSHAVLPNQLQLMVDKHSAAPILITPARMYPNGRMLHVHLRGIPSDQTLLNIPTQVLDTVLTDALPIVIGSSMARSAGLEKGSRTMIQWRDSKGTFDAVEAEVVDLFVSNVPSIDAGQVWMELTKLQALTGLPHHATIVSLQDTEQLPNTLGDFVLKQQSDLTKEIDEMIQTKSAGQSVFYIVLLLLAMLAIFDTQILSIFRRQKEIGTYIALGYTRQQVVGLFTIEGAMYAVLAAFVALLYGIPFFIWQSKVGFTIPMETSDFGMAIAPVMYPVYSVGLIVSTTLIVFVTTTIVSYLPARRIAKMNPTDALRGKIQ